jgi:enoyl-CoA hydratase/carnithine racemase
MAFPDRLHAVDLARKQCGDKMSILLRQDDGAIARLTLNSPASLNALSDAMLDALEAEFERLMTDSRTRVVIISGAGKAFCAGHDLKEMTRARAADDDGAAYFHALFTRCANIMQMIQRLPQPVIAQVHGIATAAGCQMVASCDLAVAADSTRFGVNGVNVGLFCLTPMVALSRNVTRKHSFEMLTTGDFVAAPRAVDLGLINKSVPEAELGAETTALARKITSKLSAAIRMGKRAFYEQLRMSQAEAYSYTAKVMVENMLYAGTREGINAFIEKRAPEWADD